MEEDGGQVRGRVGDEYQEGRLEPSLEWACTHVLDWPRSQRWEQGAPSSVALASFLQRLPGLRARGTQQKGSIPARAPPPTRTHNSQHPKIVEPAIILLQPWTLVVLEILDVLDHLNRRYQMRAGKGEPEHCGGGGAERSQVRGPGPQRSSI